MKTKTKEPKVWPALLMVVQDGLEHQADAPADFYDWPQVEKEVYILERWPRATFCCNGKPWDYGGQSVTLRERLPSIPAGEEV